MSARRQLTPRPGAVYAIDPRAFLDFFIEPATRENDRIGNVAIVDIDGPLEHRAGGWCDSYEAIQARVALACESDAAAVVLRVDSPGGDVAGCFDAARAIRATVLRTRKPLYAYVTDHAASAGYAIASAATAGLVISESACVGSIGVISARTDLTAANAARGVRVALITSGARKADGHPDAPITEDEIASTQALIDSTASVFFALVEDMRGVPSARVAALQAGLFVGQAAVKERLADGVESFDSFIAAVAGKKNYMAEKSKYEEARSALEEAAKGDDANAAAAKRALAAMDEGQGDEHKEPDGDEASEPDGDEPKAEEPPADDEPPKKKEGDGDDKAAATAVGASARRGVSAELTALAEVHKLRAEIAAKDARNERTRLLASRKDFAPELVKALQTAPLATVREMVKTLPKSAPIKAAATAAPAATRGEGQGGPSGSGPSAPTEIVDMDRAMGLTRTSLGVRREGNHALVFGVRETKTDFAANGGSVGGTK